MTATPTAFIASTVREYKLLPATELTEAIAAEIISDAQGLGQAVGKYQLRYGSDDSCVMPFSAKETPKGLVGRFELHSTVSATAGRVGSGDDGRGGHRM